MGATFFNSFKNSANPNSKPAMGSNEFLGVTVPHGECPGVGIGGHAQTGGAGHIARNFGYCIDYVYGFTIVTADGSIREVNRDSSEQKDKDLYWAVLGGSPGAFGVTTNLVFHPILDEDYPHSTGWDAQIPYTPERMEACLVILQEAINRAQASDDNALAEGLDMMMTCSIKSTTRLMPSDSIDDSSPMTGAGIDEGNDARLNPEKDGLYSLIAEPSMILVEPECKDMTNTEAYDQMNEIIQKFKEPVYAPSSRNPFKRRPIDMLASVGDGLDGKSHYKLSQMSLYFTRKPPGVTSTGRENRSSVRLIERRSLARVYRCSSR